MKTITVFTPTYNRASLLGKTYESLKSQTCKDFEWLIIDDGSIDNTRSLIDSFIKENKIDIRYIYQENGGKQRAINKGSELAKGELFFIVDSDDFIVPDAIERIQQEWESVQKKNEYAGLCFRKVRIGSLQLLGSPFPYPVFDSNSLDLAYHYHIYADKAEVFRTEVLRTFPFPEFEGENFVPEALIWYRISASGLKLRCVDIGIYCCEYLEDGLTKNFSSNLKRNNRGFCLFYKELLYYKNTSFYPHKIKAIIRIIQCYFYSFFK